MSLARLQQLSVKFSMRATRASTKIWNQEALRWEHSTSAARKWNAALADMFNFRCWGETSTSDLTSCASGKADRTGSYTNWRTIKNTYFMRARCVKAKAIASILSKSTKNVYATITPNNPSLFVSSATQDTPSSVRPAQISTIFPGATCATLSWGEATRREW